ncbi:hypothetical protein FC14_GL000167 [Ligilactobacillus agilis DSM 20509]|uniref:Glycosyltransferase 2-like domain-containing protein n=1 Tax=Ligilactobacillus agilis DSM 20509 TaxID=1423718 RepID=A0A0R2AAT6_9LACO|nr:glycosyltransferase [Ligilactobacillus agilis]KRM63951.1 hypothetical protein FC14_GL000167 [Ligilactobacillus agilis DSM 20509]
MEKRIKVSIIVPVYNAETFLKKCVLSIINQTYKEIEIILVDDGSNDNSLSVCKYLETQDSRIKVIEKDNGGVSTARNAGLKMAIGEWIMFVDPDDYLENNIIEKLLQHTSSRVDIVASSCNAFTNSSREEVHFFNGDRNFSTINQKKELFIQLMYPEYAQDTNFAITAIGVPWGKIYRKKLLDANSLNFKENLRRMQDNIFNMYAFYYAEKITYIDEPLYNYRYDHMSEYFDTYKKGTADVFLNVIKERKKALESINLYKDSYLFLCYVNECIRLLTIIMKSEIFNPHNLNNKKQKKLEFRQLLTEAALQDVLHFSNISKLRILKQKIVLALILLRMDNILILLCEKA